METTETKRETRVIDKSTYTSSALFEAAKWVINAKSTDETRYHMCGVYITYEGEWIATDGRRLHMWKEGPAYGEGFYRTTVTAKVITLVPFDANVPDYKRIMPHYTDEQKVIESIDFPKKLHEISDKVFKLFRETKACFDLNFIRDLGKHNWSVYGEAPDKPFHFKNDDTYEAVIAPMRVTI